MKNIKKVVSVIVALIVIVSTIAMSTVSVSAAKNEPFEGKKVYLLSKFDDQANTKGIGVIDEFGKPMTNVPNEADLKVGLPTHALEEYCGTEYVDFYNDSDATGGKAARIYVGDNYTGENAYKKTKITIRKLSSENIVIPVNGAERAKITLAFYIKLNNLAMIDAKEACIEVSEVQDEKEYQLSLESLANLLQSQGSKLEEGKWIKVELPFSAIPTSEALDSDLKVNLVRIFLNQKNKPGAKYTDANRPYMLIDELTIVQYDKAFSFGTTPVVPSPGKPGVGNPSNYISVPSSTSSTNSTPSRDTSNLPPPATDLVEKTDSSEESTVEDVTSDVTSTSSDVTDEDGFPWLWVIIGAAAVILLGGGALVLVLVLKKKPAPVADATPAEPEAPTDAE